MAKRTLRFIRLLIVTAVLLSMPFATYMQHATAKPMRDHLTNSDTQTDCATYCAARTVSSPQQAVLNYEETRTPDPAPAEYKEPYYLQFQQHRPLRVLHSYGHGSYSIRPPDIVKLSVNYRF